MEVHSINILGNMHLKRVCVVKKIQSPQNVILFYVWRRLVT